MQTTNSDGSELHRLKVMPEDYDKKLFNKLYKLVQPVIRNLVRGIDVNRLNTSPDILTSQFNDKMLFVFNKYYGTVEEEHLKANILRALSTYKNHLLKYAYSEKATFNQNLKSFEDLFDDSKEDFSDELEEQEKAKIEMWNLLKNYMLDNLSPDAQLVWEVTLNPTPYIEMNAKYGRITNTLLVDFFDLPKTRDSVRYIGELKEEIQSVIEKAKKDLHY
jgi:hypothetical protein|nr:MAG TPA: hypothetical protein [Caudoviricetes sp.]